MICESTSTQVEKKIAGAWERAWNHLFRPETNLFYDWLSSIDSRAELAHLPTATEVRQQIPNPCGWGTGMEDSMISAGVVLSMLCDQFAVTRDLSIKANIAAVFSGLTACAEVHGVRGFIARSICLEDRKSVYINSSRDQYTHFVHGCWKLYHSKICTQMQREKICAMLVDVAAYVEKCVTPENNFSLLRLDGVPCPATVCKMWAVAPHEAARLPMIYLAAYDVSRDKHWLELYLRYAEEAAEQSNQLQSRPYFAYSLLQMQCSLELIVETDHDHPELTSRFEDAMNLAADLSTWSALNAAKLLEEADPCAPFNDWRERPLTRLADVYDVPLLGRQLNNMQCIRESGESAMIRLLAPGHRFPELNRRLLREAILHTDFSKVTSHGIHYPQAAYWMARKYGFTI